MKIWLKNRNQLGLRTIARMEFLKISAVSPLIRRKWNVPTSIRLFDGFHLNHLLSLLLLITVRLPHAIYQTINWFPDCLLRKLHSKTIVWFKNTIFVWDATEMRFILSLKSLIMLYFICASSIEINSICNAHHGCSSDL